MPDKISISTIAKTIALMITIMAGIYGSMSFIDSRVEKIVNDEQFIRKVASYVRPYIIFDEKGSVFMDGGAMQYLEKPPEVVTKDRGDYQISISPKAYLAQAPLIESIGLTIFHISSKRGHGLQWIYELKALFKSGADINEPERFRLEILK